MRAAVAATIVACAVLTAGCGRGAPSAAPAGPAPAPVATARAPKVEELSVYPSSPALDSVARCHGPEGAYPASGPKIMSATWLRGGPSFAMRCDVDRKGVVWTCRDIHSWAYQGTKRRQLSQGLLKRLGEALLALPEGEEKPPLARLLIVSFDRDGRWLTRLYDRDSLPVEVAELYEIAGAYLKADCGALEHILLRHRYGQSIVPGSHGVGAPVLQVTRFTTADAGVFDHCEVSGRGSIFACRYVHDWHSKQWPYSGKRRRKLQPLKLKDALAAAAKLPPGKKPETPLEDVLIVSWKAAPDIIVRVYDAEPPPAALSELLGALEF